MKIFAIANQKGGVGKTAVACHLAFFLAERGKSVLFIDIDPQANSSKTMKDGSQSIKASKMFLEPVTLTEIKEGITLIPADSAMADMERADPQVISQFKKNIDSLKGHFDYCVIDTPPTLGIRVTTALIVADYVLSPIKPEGYSIDGIVDLLKVILGVKKKYNPKLHFLGMLPCLVKGNSPDHKRHLSTLVNGFHEYLLEGAVIGDRQSVDEALNSSVPVWHIKKTAAKDAGKEFKNTFDLIGQKIGGF